MKQLSIFCIGLLVVGLVSCGKGGSTPEVTPPDKEEPEKPDDDDDMKDPTILDGDYRFLITARQASNNDPGPSYLLQVGHVDGGVVKLSDNGWQADQNGGTADASIWFYPENKAAYHFVYRQGPSDVSSYLLNDAGSFVKGTIEYQIPDGSGTFGTWENKMVTVNNFHSNGKLYSRFTFFDPDTKEATEKTIPTQNITGSNGDIQHQFSGVVGVGDKFYSSICIPGRTDSVWVFEFDKDLNYRIIKDDRIAYSSGRFRSIYFGQMDADEQGNLYVFSSSFEEKTTKPSGALRIKKGAGEFDKEYYFNIEALTGGRAVYKVWHIKGDYFLIQTYTLNEKSQAEPDVKRLAIANMEEKTLKWVSGIPEEKNIVRIGNTPCVHEGKIIMPITTNDAYPYIYKIDPETATATKGLQVEAGSVLAIGILNHKNK